MSEIEKIKKIELYGWLGEDEMGSGYIGLKQARVPAGRVPMVAVTEAKMSQQYIQEQMQRQADAFGKTIRLCRFVFSEVVIEITPQPVVVQPPEK